MQRDCDRRKLAVDKIHVAAFSTSHDVAFGLDEGFCKLLP